MKLSSDSKNILVQTEDHTFTIPRVNYLHPLEEEGLTDTEKEVLSSWLRFHMYLELKEEELSNCEGCLRDLLLSTGFVFWQSPKKAFSELWANYRGQFGPPGIEEEVRLFCLRAWKESFHCDRLH